MGEKPLSTDEAPAQLGTIMGAGPPAVVDVPPPGMTAGSIITTRSNIKSGGSAAAAGVLPPKPLQPPPTRPGDPFPTGPLPSDGAMAKEEVPEGNAGGSEPAGIAIKENGVKVDGGAAMEGDPIPGLDVKLGKNPGGSASAGGPDGGLDETSGEDDLDPMAGAGIVVTTRSNIKSSGSAVVAPDAPSDAGPVSDAGPAGEPDGQTDPLAGAAGQPIPGVNIVIKKNPPAT